MGSDHFHALFYDRAPNLLHSAGDDGFSGRRSDWTNAGDEAEGFLRQPAEEGKKTGIAARTPVEITSWKRSSIVTHHSPFGGTCIRWRRARIRFWCVI